MLTDRGRRDFSDAGQPGNNVGLIGSTASCLELKGENKNVQTKRSEMVDCTTCAVADRET